MLHTINHTTIKTMISGYQVELTIGDDSTYCQIEYDDGSGVYSASLEALWATGVLDARRGRGERPVLDKAISRIADWAIANGY
jgi:hypothetical protein